MKLTGSLGWLIILLVLACAPILDALCTSFGFAWAVPGVEGIVLGLLMWNVYASLRGEGLRVGRRWDWPNVLTLGGIAIVAFAWWDPYDFLGSMSHFLAGGGFLESVLVRLARGALTLAGAYVILLSMRPTDAQVAKKHAKRAKASRSPKAPAEDLDV